MKKLTALFTALLMVLTTLLVSTQVSATDDALLSEDNSFPFILDIWGANDEKVTEPICYYPSSVEGRVSKNNRQLYGQFDVKFRLQAKAGVTVKIIPYVEYETIEDLGKKFTDATELTAGSVTELYKLVEGDGTLLENRFLMESEIDGKISYGEISFECFSKDFFEIQVDMGTFMKAATEVIANNKTADGETIIVENDLYPDVVRFHVNPAKPYSENFNLKINGHVNTGCETVAEGDNYFKIEYKGKTYNLILRRPETTAWTNPFTDVSTSDVFFNSLKHCNMNGLMFGTSDTTFTPDATTTRAMVVTTLYRIAGSPAVNGANKFSDVEEGSWYYDAVIWASENGIVLGYDNGKFGTNDNITREQFATIMFRYAKMQNPELYVDYDRDWYSRDDVADYAVESMMFAVMTGIIKTTDTVNLTPKDNVSRADLAIGIAALNTLYVPEIQGMYVVTYY